MKALLEVARELELETSGWGPLMAAFEHPMADELARGYAKLLEHFRAHRVDIAEIRREVAARQVLGRPTLSPATRGATTQRPDWLEEVARVSDAPVTDATRRPAAAWLWLRNASPSSKSAKS